MITLITPTSDRPDVFKICEKYMARQTYQDFHWIVVDDGHHKATPTLGQTHIKLPPQQDSVQSFRLNILTALSHIQYEPIFVIEDDDWYAPQYLEEMLEKGSCYDIAGEGRAKYYNVPTRTYHIHQNDRHASLCQTMFRYCLVPIIHDFFHKNTSKFLDMHLWRNSTQFSQKVFPESTLCVGIKGLQGKLGLGKGHSKLRSADPAGAVLKSWIGDDADTYLHQQF